jgi:iron complex outermembrane receptor protein
MKKILTLFLFLSTVLKSQIQLQEIKIESLRGDEKTPLTEKTYKDSILKNISVGQEVVTFLGKTTNSIFYTDGGSDFGYAYFRLRGIDQTRINFTLDGIPMNDGEDQGFYSSNFPDFLNNISSLQIQRGVGLSTNGVASYGGSINMLTSKPNEELTSSVRLTYGSFNTYRQAINVAFNKKYYSSFKFSRIQSDNFRRNSGIEGQTANFILGRDWDRFSFKIFAFTGNSKSQMAYLAADEDSLKKDWAYNPLRKEEKDDFKQHFTYLENSYRINKFLITNKLYYNKIIGQYDVNIIPDLYVFNLNSNSYGDILNLAYRGLFKLDVGAHVNFFDRTHKSGVRPFYESWLYSNTGYKQEYSFYLKLQKDIKNFTSYIDLQSRNVNFYYFKNSKLGPLKYNFINPKIGFSYNLNKSQLYTTLGKNHREPTRNDILNGYDDVDIINNNTFLGFGVDTLKFNRISPESVLDFEFGYKLKKNNLNLNLNFFNMQFKNEIVPIGQLSYIGLPMRKNVKESYRRGLELDLNYQYKHLNISLDFSYIDAKIKEYYSEIDSITYKNVTPLLTPKYISNQSIGLKYKYFSINISNRYVSESNLTNTNSQNKLPSYYNISSNLETYFKNHTLSIKLDNITNNKYYNSGYVIGSKNHFFVTAPRRFYIDYILTF